VAEQFPGVLLNVGGGGTVKRTGSTL